LSQSISKSKRRIEIEKLSDNENYEESYQEDEFEESSNKKKDEKPARRKINQSSGSKQRPQKPNKDATPIKEEDAEEELSDGDNHFKRQVSGN
jgi:hypothetical protein